MSPKPAPEKRPRRRIGVEGQRVQILLGAMEALQHTPYEQLSVEHILAAAGVSRQTFYRCFRNKAEVFHAAFRDGNTLFLTALRSLDRGGDDPVAIADRALTGALLFMVHGGGPLRAMYRETTRHDSEFAPYRREVFDAVVQDIVEWTKMFSRQAVDATLVRAILLAIESMIFELSSKGSPSHDEIEHFRGNVKLLLEGVWRELQRREHNQEK